MPAAPTRQTAREMERRVFGGNAGENIEQKKEKKYQAMTGGESAWSRGQVGYVHWTYRTQRHHLLLGHRQQRLPTRHRLRKPYPQ